MECCYEGAATKAFDLRVSPDDSVMQDNRRSSSKVRMATSSAPLK